MTSLLCAFTLTVAAPVPEDKPDAEFQKKIDTARAKAVKYLKDKQDKEGSWEGIVLGDIAGLKGGVTALAALSLLEAGVPVNDPTVAKAVEYLLKVKPEKTYAVSLQTQVLARVDAKKYAKEIQANADWLMETAITKENKLRGWSYPYKGAAGDNSNTHFAVMGLHAAAQAGAKVDPKIWQKIRDYFADTQKADGNWTYHSQSDVTPSHSMTVVGLLAITVATKYDKQAKGPDPAFEKGMKILLSGKLGELGDGKSIFVSWMTTAELGRAIGSTEFKSGKMTKAWYREGAEKLLKTQKEDGSLSEAGEDKRGIDAEQFIITTACGLYFLGPPAKK
jgi:hypothetical protein